jgi:hypothetical protein
VSPARAGRGDGEAGTASASPARRGDDVAAPAVALMLVARQASASSPHGRSILALERCDHELIIVLAITVAGSRIGVIATISILLAGQFAAGAVIDRYGLLGAERVSVGWLRVLGIVLLGIGAGLTLKK